MSEPRFRVTSCTGYRINPRAEPGSHGKQSWTGGTPSAWQVLDTHVLCTLIAEWRPAGRRSPKVCEARAREHAAALNAWDAAGCEGPAPRLDRVPPSRRPDARREANRIYWARERGK